MIAFKLFQQAPSNILPPGMPLDNPWMMQYCEAEDVAYLRSNGWKILSEESYEAYINSISDMMAAYESAKAVLGIEQVVNEATKFGQALMVSYAAENVLLGITQENMTGTILNRLAGVLTAIQSGSLYEVISRIREIPETDYDEKYITEARLLVFINKIEAYLELPLSTGV